MASRVVALTASGRDVRVAFGGARALHITVTIGVNDVAGEALTLADAASLPSFARRHGVGALLLRATFRDRVRTGEDTSTASVTRSGRRTGGQGVRRGAQSLTAVPQCPVPSRTSAISARAPGLSA
ncbi:hypothetical protein [Streptomyces sp. NBC_00236]|uniref:hypothetical protein n=1 Tax=unclassified Streptomyces TaxID=2593676 RepID=UPI002E2D968F|nr:hypothetical protein [Streptomyces sp. NBC_00236]